MSQNVKYSAAIAKGKKMQDCAITIKKTLSAINTEMSEVAGSTWQSPKASSFRNKYDTLSQSFEEVFKAINTMGQAIENSGKAYQDMQ